MNLITVQSSPVFPFRDFKVQQRDGKENDIKGAY